MVAGRSTWPRIWSRCQTRAHCVVLAWLAISPALVTAQAVSEVPSVTTSNYEGLIEEGLTAYGAHRYAEARVLFARAHEQKPSARTLRALGIADLALDNYTMAKDEFTAALDHRTTPLTREQRKEVVALLAWMRGNLQKVHLEHTPVHAQVVIDGKPVADQDVLLQPAEHEIVVSAHGFMSYERKFKLEPSQPLTLRIALIAQPTAAGADAPKPTPTPALDAPPAPEAPAQPDTSPVVSHDTMPLWPWLGGGGIALLAAGGTMLVLGLNDKADVEDARRGERLANIEAAHDRVPWLTGVGTALGVLGVAGIAGAAVLLLTERTPREHASWSLDAGPTHVGLTKRF